MATSRESLAKEILERDPKPLRQIDRSIPVRLESTCLRCLAKLPADRYASAADLASDLARCRQPSRRRFWLAAAVFLVSTTCLFAGFLWFAGTDLAPAKPLDATLDLLISAGDHTAGTWLPLSRHEAAPVRSGSLVSCIAERNQPAYAYLIWIDHEGIATPLYPWRSWGDGRIAQETQRLDGRDDPHLTTVIQNDSDGTETVMLLARDQPLSAEEERFLFSALGNLGPQTAIPLSTTLRFNNGQMAPNEDAETTLVGETDDNSVIVTQRRIYERLKDHFEIIRANTFAVEENSDQGIVSAADASTTVTGYVDVFVWSENDASRRAVPLRDPGARPLRTGDLIRLNVKVSKPQYVYLLWIDSEGKASPVYPWIPGQWADRPDNEEQVEILSLPENTDDGWPISGQDCMESIVLLTSDTPLPKTVDIPNMLATIPSQKMQNPRTLLWFEGGELVVRDLDRHRGPQWFDPKRINDPICETQRMIFQQLKPHFRLICANSFAVAEK